MRNRPAAFARRDIRRAWRHAAAANVRVLLVSWLVVVVLGAGLYVQPLPLWVRTFELGALLAGTVAATAWVVHLASGMHGRQLGRSGEECTASTILGLGRRRRGWQLVNGLYFKEHGDVDHVLVCPHGVFVFESKWVSRPCEVEAGAVVGVMGREPVAQARAGARKVELALRYGRNRVEVEVVPVVVLWGPGAPELPGGCCLVDGVLVCEGRRRREWLPVLRRGDADGEQIARAGEVLLTQLARQDDPGPMKVVTGVGNRRGGS